MPRKIDLEALRRKSAEELATALERYEVTKGLHYSWRRWTARMTAVDIHAVWERYVETRLVAALNHSPQHFLEGQNIASVTRIPPGLARYIVRGGRNFTDFRSTGDLMSKADHLLGKGANPFKSLTTKDRSFIDCLAAIRNHVVHGSDASIAAYRRSLKAVFEIKTAPGPDEFLNAKDNWTPSPARYKSRLHVLAEVIARTIQNT